VAFVAPMWNSNTARYSEKWVKFWFTQRRTRCAGKKIPRYNSVVALVQKYGMMLEKYPNQRSMHSCGILISEEPLQITPFRNASQRPLALFDIAENIGFEKFDILSSGIGHIDDTVKLVKKNRGLKSIFEIQHYQKRNKV
jgi:DNA polymerase III alpha subunit